MSKRYLVLFLVWAISTTPVGTLAGRFYKWIDEKGNAHFVEDYEAIPEQYRGQVEKESVSEDSTTKEEKTKTKKQKKMKLKSSPPKGQTQKQQTNMKKIESDATDCLNDIVKLWKDGKYNALYEYGTLKSKTMVTKEDFEQRMVGKTKGLASSWETIRDIEIYVKNPTSVYATARLGFKPKRGGDANIRTVTYQLILEKGMWRIDLLKIMRATD